MSRQLWISCPKSEAENVKILLGKNLDRSLKITNSAANEGILDIPTTVFHELHNQPSGRICFEPGSNVPASIRCVSRARIPQKPSQTPVEIAVSNWLDSLPKNFLLQLPLVTKKDLLESLPKGWTVYHPMVMLPTGSFQDEPWKSVLNRIRIESRTNWYGLWEAILCAIQKHEGQQVAKRVTHLAVNAGIPLEHKTVQVSANIKLEPGSSQIKPHLGSEDVLATRQNILRSPNGLIMLYGNFGPSICELEDEFEPIPSTRDFNDAFWVSTNQNGIYQTWAPRHTMFSRGNIKEKARILNFHNHDRSETLRPEVDTRRNAIETWELQAFSAVDLYAGIGYFTFSYLKMGIGRVFCWEINPWSIEGLRRGAVKNGWSIKVLNEKELGDFESGRTSLDQVASTEDIVVFPEDNRAAKLRLVLDPPPSTRTIGDILHVNCGLLPTSKKSWEAAYSVLTRDRSQGWLHIHENVALADVDSKKTEIEDHFKSFYGEDRVIEVEHVELVKTFAPGVWHCVYDVWFGPKGEGLQGENK